MIDFLVFLTFFLFFITIYLHTPASLFPTNTLPMGKSTQTNFAFPFKWTEITWSFAIDQKDQINISINTLPTDGRSLHDTIEEVQENIRTLFPKECGDKEFNHTHIKETNWPLNITFD